jgi:hypothetical protein
MKLKAVAEPLGFQHRVFDLSDRVKLEAALKEVDAVLHIAGPFSTTSKPMADACVRTRTHYLDITGEIDVFEALAARDMEAKKAGIMLLPGVGFDVVPSDCLALHLKQRMPDATEDLYWRLECTVAWYRKVDGRKRCARHARTPGRPHYNAIAASESKLRFRRRAKANNRDPLGRRIDRLLLDQHTKH